MAKSKCRQTAWLFENFCVFRFVEAAELLAESVENFETCTLKFLRHDSRAALNGLKRFLELKLKSVGASVSRFNAFLSL